MQSFMRYVRAFAASLVVACAICGTTEVEAAPKAAIVMDLRNGDVLHARSADARRHPASLTKMMTLYLTFEAVRDGRLRLDQKLRVSRHAARQPASKLYLRAGQRVSVRSLIRATAIKSANDAAMVLAEAVGGSQSGFARLMTSKAKALGMNNSRFKNPHGLTQTGHYSTARDMAILARHLFFDYPKYYNVFSRKTDYAAGKRIWNTNRLLSTYNGADGLKTGYTRAAGYNLAATAHRGSKRILAVQLGANSSGDRARRVARLLDMGFVRAKRNVRRVPPRGARREQILVSRAPVPPRKPGQIATGVAAMAEVLSAAPAQAATPSARQNLIASPRAPLNAELPMPRRGTVVAVQRGAFPVPVPKPIRVAALQGRPWAAELGPFGSESAALTLLAGLPDTMGATLTKLAVADGSSAFAIVVPQDTRIGAVRACGVGFAEGANCRIRDLQGG